MELMNNHNPSEEIHVDLELSQDELTRPGLDRAAAPEAIAARLHDLIDRECALSKETPISIEAVTEEPKVQAMRKPRPIIDINSLTGYWSVFKSCQRGT